VGRIKAKFVCQECGTESSKWFGRCPGCEAWNSLVEEVESKSSQKTAWFGKKIQSVPQSLADITTEEQDRYSTNSSEFDRVLGDGIVPGSVVLIGGDPGIGKSTLLLQLAYRFARTTGTVLYVSGEESAKQIKLRAERLGSAGDRLFIYSENNLELVISTIARMKPGLVIIDSIQTVYNPDLSSAPGSVSQLRECTAQLASMAKSEDIPVFIVGHVTKEGAIAGPRVLEHIVDTVLYLEGERHHSYRILRAVKNRFGSTNEIGIFEMTGEGMNEVINPSQFLLAERSVNVSGSVVVPSMEGSRPVVVELQALVTSSNFGTARRTTAGVDYNRVILISAVLEKKVGLQLANQDVYVNITGGIKIDEPALDLGIAVAIASSFRNTPVAPGLVVLGEIGLTGEVRGVNRIEQRIRESYKLGFERFIVPERNYRDLKSLKNLKGVNLIGVQDLATALDLALGG
jgi:DNA repair protein RadA/Sms